MEQYPPQFSILIHYAEIGLKGKNQPLFRRRLAENIRVQLRQLDLKWRVRQPRGSFSVRVLTGEESKIPMAMESLRQVSGIAWLSSARRLRRKGQTLDAQTRHLTDVEKHLVEIASAEYMPNKTFVVRVRRADKTITFTSTQLEARFGEVLLQKTSWNKVKLKGADATFEVEMRKDSSYVFSQRIKGMGGLPVGTTGRVLALLSGGIDSPVAAYLMAKRGCHVDFIHFTASSVDVEQAKAEKMWRMVQRLNGYTLGSRLFILPYTHFDLALMQHQARYDVVLFRRFMIRVAEELAKQLKCEALVTGDNLSQVASQTLSNLARSSEITKLPLLRPLLTFDKQEIIQLALEIGTYDISIEPYKDCCALIARNPRTTSKAHKIERMESHIFSDYKKLIDDTLAEAVELSPKKLSKPEHRGGEDPAGPDEDDEDTP